jgi:hypothetical protein
MPIDDELRYPGITQPMAGEPGLFGFSRGPELMRNPLEGAISPGGQMMPSATGLAEPPIPQPTMPPAPQPDERSRLYQRLQEVRRPTSQLTTPELEERTRKQQIANALLSGVAGLGDIGAFRGKAAREAGVRAPSQFGRTTALYERLGEKIGRPLTQRQELAAKMKPEIMKKKEVKPLSLPQIDKLNDARALTTDLKGLEGVIDASLNKFGKIKGNLKTLQAKAGFEDEVGKLMSSMRPVQQLYGRLMEGGVLRQEDEIKYREQFPQLSDTPGVAAHKIRFLKNMLLRRFKSHVELLGKQGYSQAGFEEILGLDIPKIEESFAKQQKKEAKPRKEVTRKQYNPSRNQTRIFYSDGSMEIVDGRQ